MSTEDTSNTDNWRDNIPEQIREAPYFKNAETVDQVIADLTSAAAWQGNSIRIPGPDASEEQVAEFMQRATEKIPGLMVVPDEFSEDYGPTLTKLGLPDKAEDYKVPEGVELDGDLLGNLKVQAHQANLTQAQFQRLLATQAESMTTAGEQAQAVMNEQNAIIKTEWGEATDDRLAKIADFLKDGPQELVAAFDNKQMNADTVRWLYDLADSMGETNNVVRMADGQEAVLTPGEARDQAADVLDRLQKMPPSDKRYQELVHKRVELMRMAGA